MNKNINPLYLCYNNVQGVRQLAGASAVFIAGHENRYDTEFIYARSVGSEIYAYFNLVSRPDVRVGPLNESFYMGDHTKVPLWPYPDYGKRSIYPDTHLTDIQVGSIWTDHAVKYLSDVMAEGRIDGFFFDVLGSQLWSTAQFQEWPAQEQALWRQGAVDLIRRIDEARRKINPNFKIVTNNTWPKAPEAEKYIDGVCAEHHPYTNTFMVNYMNKPFSDLGHKRSFVVALNQTDVDLWANSPGVTHVALVPKNSSYGTAISPHLPYNDIRAEELIGQLNSQIVILKDQLSLEKASNVQLTELLTIERNDNEKLRDGIESVLLTLEKLSDG